MAPRFRASGSGTGHSRRERRFVRTAGFFRALPVPVKAALPARLKEINHRVRSSQAQWFFDDPRLHFEAWWHADSRRLKLGLHMETTPAQKERIATSLDRQLMM